MFAYDEWKIVNDTIVDLCLLVCGTEEKDIYERGGRAIRCCSFTGAEETVFAQC